MVHILYCIHVRGWDALTNFDCPPISLVKISKICEDNWKNNSGEVWKGLAAICRKSGALKVYWLPYRVDSHVNENENIRKGGNLELRQYMAHHRAKFVRGFSWTHVSDTFELVIACNIQGHFGVMFGTLANFRKYDIYNVPSYKISTLFQPYRFYICSLWQSRQMLLLVLLMFKTEGSKPILNYFAAILNWRPPDNLANIGSHSCLQLARYPATTTWNYFTAYSYVIIPGSR